MAAYLNPKELIEHIVKLHQDERLSPHEIAARGEIKLSPSLVRQSLSKAGVLDPSLTRIPEKQARPKPRKFHPANLGKSGMIRGTSPVGDLGLSGRTRNTLLRYGYRTVEDLHSRTPRDLMDMRAFGRGCLEELIDRLLELGVLRNELKDEDEALVLHEVCTAKCIARFDGQKEANGHHLVRKLGLQPVGRVRRPSRPVEYLYDPIEARKALAARIGRGSHVRREDVSAGLLRNLRGEGRSQAEISRIVGMSETGVRNRLRELGIK